MPGESGTVIGLSKLNRIADWCARRPQVQERLTNQIQNYINKFIPDNKGIAVIIEAKHQCCSNRGIKHDSTMKTMVVTGAFRENESIKQELMFLLTK